MIGHNDDPCSEINNVIGLAALLATLLDDRIHGSTQGIYFQQRPQTFPQYCSLFTDLLIGNIDLKQIFCAIKNKKGREMKKFPCLFNNLNAIYRSACGAVCTVLLPQFSAQVENCIGHFRDPWCAF